MPEAFFFRDGDLFVPTELTRGPWDDSHQHAGPPSALIGQMIESAEGGAGKRVARITLEILRPIPIEPLLVAVRVVRPGRKVDLVEASMSTQEQEIVRATAWRIISSTNLPSTALRPSPPGPEKGSSHPFFDTGARTGYHTGVEWRFIEGSFVDPGPATVWIRARVPLIDDRELTALGRVLIAADSGNGVSALLDPREFLFINTDLNVFLRRKPAGEWICLDAQTTIDPEGSGLTETRLFDVEGDLGLAVQTLFISPR